MTQVEARTNEEVKSSSAGIRRSHLVQSPIERILKNLSRIELPAKEHFEHYLRHKWRLNPNAPRSRFLYAGEALSRVLLTF